MMKSSCPLPQVTGNLQYQHWGWHIMIEFEKLWQVEIWQCINLKAVSIQTSDAGGAAHTLCLYIFGAAI